VADQLPPGTFVVVSGPPASGKTTLARAIAPALGLPLIAKDTIKQALMTVLPVPDIETSRIVGSASVAALLAVAAETAGAVLESAHPGSRHAQSPQPMFRREEDGERAGTCRSGGGSADGFANETPRLPG
jgi:MoxR-like ATPase